MLRDFLCFDGENQGLVWLFALSDGMDDGGNAVVDCAGGCYVAYTYRDGGEEANNRLYQEVAAYIEASEVLEPDIRPGRLTVGHIITPSEVTAA